MTNFARLLFLAGIFLGLARFSQALAEPPSETALVMLLQGSSPGYYLLVNGKEFHDTDTLKEFVSKHAAGSVLKWDSGCIMYEKMPLGGPELSMAAFRSFCAKHGVDFRYTCGW